MKVTDPKHKKLLRTIMRTARTMAVWRFRGNIEKANKYAQKFDRLVRMAKRHGMGDLAVLAEERGWQRGTAIHRKTGLYRKRGYSQHRVTRKRVKGRAR